MLKNIIEEIKLNENILDKMIGFFTKTPIKKIEKSKPQPLNVSREVILTPSAFTEFEKINKVYIKELKGLRKYKSKSFDDRVFVLIQAKGSASGRSVLKYLYSLSQKSFFGKYTL